MHHLNAKAMQQPVNPIKYDHVRLTWDGSQTMWPVLEFMRDGVVVRSVAWRRREETLTLRAEGVVDLGAVWTVSV